MQCKMLYKIYIKHENRFSLLIKQNKIYLVKKLKVFETLKYLNILLLLQIRILNTFPYNDLQYL